MRSSIWGAFEYQGAASTPLTVVTQPVSINFCTGTAGHFSVTASGDSLTYQWQVDRHDGNGFTALSDNAAISGSAAATLTINLASSADNGNAYRCEVTSAAGCSITSASATLAYPVARWYVDANGAGGNGSSWEHALHHAEPGDGRRLCALQQRSLGSRREPMFPRTAVMLCRTMWLLWRFCRRRNQSGPNADWNANPTIIDGQASDSFLIQNQDASHPIGRSAQLDGFILQNAAGTAVNLLDGQSPKFANCVFQGNTFRANYNRYSTP